MAEVIRNKGFACHTLQAAFDLTLESAKILRMIRDVRQALMRPEKNRFILAIVVLVMILALGL